MTLEELKWHWKADPCWDLEDTGGFEAHREELLQFRVQCETEWEQQRVRRLSAKAVALGVPGNLALAEYVERLETRMRRLEAHLFQGVSMA